MKGNTMTTLTALIRDNPHIPDTLIRAVVRQSGGWQAFRESAQCIADHGAQSGFPGFIYYKDTCDFYRRQQANIVALAEEIASDLGEVVTDMVAGFNCLQPSGQECAEVAKTLYGTPRHHEQQTANALAWFALEEVACACANN